MPWEVSRLWQSGLDRLYRDPALQFGMDHWRGWPRGTTSRLCERRLIGLISEPGKTCLLLAFAVEFPTSAGLIQVGYHAREAVAPDGRKPAWHYRPSERHEQCSCVSVPFVLGAEELPRCSLVVILEGQWDAVMWAAVAGWFDRWPSGAVVFGLRGGSTWKVFLEAWIPFFRTRVPMLLIPDGDAAGRQWQQNLSKHLAAAGHRVGTFFPAASMDFSDLHCN